MNFTLRDFRQADFESLWRIDQQCFAPGISYTRVELATYLRRPRAFCLVAQTPKPQASVANNDDLEGDALTIAVGFIVAEAGNRGSGHIITIDVMPDARGAGIGSQLLRAAEDRLCAADCHTIILETAVNNRVALSFYEAHGYNVVNTISRYYADGLDALVLRKDLLSQPEPAKLPK